MNKQSLWLFEAPLRNKATRSIPSKHYQQRQIKQHLVNQKLVSNCPELVQTNKKVYGWEQYKTKIEDLPTEQRKLLTEVGDIIMASFRPGCKKIRTIYVYGHADYDSPRNPQNEREKSNQRAQLITNWLKGYIGSSIAASITWYTKGLGANQLDAPPTTEENRKKNRRVEIFLSITVSKPTPPCFEPTQKLVSRMRLSNLTPANSCPITPDWFADIIPIIIVPGIMGTRLIDPSSSELIYNPTGVFYSPDTRQSKIGGRGFGKFAAKVERLQNIDSPLIPAIDSNIPNTDKFKIYKAKADKIKNFGNLLPDYYDQLAFTLSDDSFAQQIGKQIRVYFCGYDWRQDNAQSASRLDAIVNQALQETRAKKVIIIAHSMGGLVSRYYCSLGANNQPKGEDKVRSLILLGSPTHGSPKAYRTLKTGITYSDDFQLRMLFFDLYTDSQKIFFLRRFPSIYQLLPTSFYCSQRKNWLMFNPKKTVLGPFFPPAVTDASDPVSLYQNHYTGFTDVNVIDPQIDKNLQLRQNFDQKLGKSMPDPQKVTTHIIYSGGGLNNSTLQFQSIPTESQYRLIDPQNSFFELIIGREMGDGTVPTFSAAANNCLISGEVINVMFVKHDKLPNDRDVQNHIKRLVQQLIKTP